MISIQVWSVLIFSTVLQQCQGQLLSVDNYEQQYSNDNCECTDIPPGDIWTCEEQAGWGKCDRQWMSRGNYCAKTCGRCNCDEGSLSTSASINIQALSVAPSDTVIITESAKPQSCACDDLPPNQASTCEQQKRWGKCERNWMKAPRSSAPNGFCATTCGRCSCEVIEEQQQVPQASGGDCVCSDIAPMGSAFDCKTQSRFGKCEASWMLATTEHPNGYCQISCGRCTCRQTEEDHPCDILRQNGNAVSILRVSSVAVSNVESATVASLSSAIAQVEGGSKNAVSAAQESSEAIGLAVADAVATVSISGCTQGENSRASGFGSAESDAFARAVGSAIAESFASAGSSQVSLNASTFEQVVKTALAYAEASVSISGDAEVDVVSSAVSSAVACVLAESLSKAFAQLDDAIAQSVVSVNECPQELINQLTDINTDQQLFTAARSVPKLSPIPVPTPTPSPARVCQDVQPSTFRRTCQFVAAMDRCNQVLPGECERSCGKCQV
eukprot:TRINITY_DN557_c3_g1_i1.p1 TRINITY_DN557_c3_g1~~TRINITY_DN557_c3_g1_i1.p1  ORF type:complete len:547 (+),score=111.69 TRINITY_DN557_c3_g1_i1:142-1641(+)